MSYSIKIAGEKYSKLIASTDEECKKIFASEILNSLSDFDVQLRKVNDFDSTLFKADLAHFFKENNLL
jgi:hypothetical protein